MSATAANLGCPMHQLYPEHAKALQHAGLSGSHFPTLKQVLDSMLNQKTIVTALVIAQAGGAIMEMLAARHSLSIRSLLHALAPSITLVQHRRR
jgi:hypothetical protein